MNEIILMTHVFFGIACMLAAAWVFVDVLNVSDANVARVRKASWAAAVFMWIAFIVAGYWYVTLYKVDKAIILKGPWPFAHNMVMESKEHLVIMLLLLATYLPIAAADNLVGSKDARKVTLWTAGIVALLALAMDGEGGIIAMGVKMGLLHK